MTDEGPPLCVECRQLLRADLLAGHDGYGAAAPRAGRAGGHLLQQVVGVVAGSRFCGFDSGPSRTTTGSFRHVASQKLSTVAMARPARSPFALQREQGPECAAGVLEASVPATGFSGWLLSHYCAHPISVRSIAPIMTNDGRSRRCPSVRLRLLHALGMSSLRRHALRCVD